MKKKVAIIGYSFRLPGTARETFWEDLVAGKNLVSEIPRDRWPFEKYLHPDKSHPGTSYTFKAGTLGDVSGFDAEFFGISPREAAVVDPQQRYLLELTWEALEHAGIPADSLKKSRTGVYLGMSSIDYAYRMADDMACVTSSTATGNTGSIAANRISYTFDLHGPSFSLDTACSSSLYAFHHACQAIQNGEIPTAITGGMSLLLHPFGFIAFSKATMLSPNGECRFCDTDANGYVRAEGGGIFVLKEYEKAVADGDLIHAVIAGSGVNIDGYKSGITIPSWQSQAALMGEVYENAGIQASQIDYLEAHGTGTPVGDPIETHAIGQALGLKRDKPLLFGSIKSNMGHLEPASGIAGLIKALHVIKNRAVPPTMSMHTPNPNIDFKAWNIQLAQDVCPLSTNDQLTVGVNSFGFGGANAHVILQSHPQQSETESLTKIGKLPWIISGKNAQAVQDNAGKLLSILSSVTSAYDIAWHLAHCKQPLKQGAVFFADSLDSAKEKLLTLATGKTSTEYIRGNCLARSDGPVFVYSGNGCQWEGMGAALLTDSAIFRDTIEEIDSYFKKLGDFSIKEELALSNGKGRLAKTEIAQPTLFALQVGITRVLISQGIKPVAVTGHSVGEVAAAWACGALNLKQAVEVIYYRSHFQGITHGLGGMTAVNLSHTEINNLLQKLKLDLVEVAGINSYQAVTLAGSTDQLEQLENYLVSNNTFHTRLGLDYAFHSTRMNDIESELRKALDDLKPSSAKVPFYSTVSGTVLDGKKLDAEYWWQNIRQPVLFEKAIDALLDDGNNCFIEVGAHPVLRHYLKEQSAYRQIHTEIIAIQSRKYGHLAELEKAIGLAILANAYDRQFYFPIAGKRQELPTNVWQHETFWYESSPESIQLLTGYAVHPLLGTKQQHQSFTWENRLSLGTQAWLKGHDVGGSVVLPGAAFIETALQAASHFKASDTIELENLEIIAPIILDEAHDKITRTHVSASGNIEIHSRTYNTDEPWRLNARAKCVHEASGLDLQDIEFPASPEKHSNIIDNQQHYRLTDLAGLNYSGAFCSVRTIRQIPDGYLATLQLDKLSDTAASDYFLHPGLLDSAIQVVIHEVSGLLEHVQGIAYVPISLAKISYRKTQATPVYALLRCLSVSAQSLLTRIELYDADKTLLAVIHNLRYRAVRLHNVKQKLTFLDYHLQAKPLVQKAITGLSEKVIAALGKGFYSNAELQKLYQHEFLPLVDSYLQQSLQEFLLALETGSPGQLTEWLEKENPKHNTDPFIRKLLDAARTYGLIDDNQDSPALVSVEMSNDLNADMIWNTLVREYADFSEETLQIGRFNRKVQHYLDGNQAENKKQTTQPAFQKYFTAHYARFARKTMQKLSGVIHDLQTQLNAGERLCIGELADKHSYLGSTLLAEIDFRKTDFIFSAAHEETLQNFSDSNPNYPLALTCLLDNKATLSMAGNVQMAVITADHDNLAALSSQLMQLQPLLCHNATVLISGLNQQFWHKLVFSEYQSDIDSNNCKNLLNQLGFINIHSVTDEMSIHDHFILTAQWPADIGNISQPTSNTPEAKATQKILLLGNPGAYENRIATALIQRSNDYVVEKCHFETISSLLSSLSGTNSDSFKIFFFSDLSDTFDDVSKRCAEIAEIHQLLEHYKVDMEVIVFTRHVAQMFNLHNALSHEALVANDAAIWGFARTLMNEALNYRLRLIDLPEALNPAVLNQLVSDIISSSPEKEVFYNEAGERYVPRLNVVAQPFISTKSQPSSTRFRTTLQFDLPGQLKNLQWKRHIQNTLQDNHVEISVLATGLNFRDVMYALGLLSDEAIENGFAGASLGLEFAGRVTAVGKNIKKFQVNDRVVGFNTACFSDRIICSPETLVKIPYGLSYASATTIPTTFLTVYYALKHLANLKAGERVLIHGAAGGVGLAAIQVAQWLGAEIFATVGSEEKRDYIRLLGVKHIYNSRDLTFADRILHATPDRTGVDVILNSLAGEAINQNLKVLRPFGRFLELGKRDFYENTAIGLRPFRNNLSYFGIDADQLQKELPDLARQLFEEVMQGFNNGDFFPLPYTEFPACDVIHAFRYMQQARQIGKVVVTYPESLSSKSPLDHSLQQQKLSSLRLSAEGVYVVTGGLGGFGLATAEWLVRKGAKKLMLLSRRGPASEEAKDFLADAARKDISIKAVSCDVSDFEQLNHAFTECTEEFGAIKGIIHAATVIEDDLAINLDKDKIQRSMQAKISGAINLHEASRKNTLEFFVVYSSVTTLWGNPGQASYVAANHWLEAFTAYRRQLGLPATCVRWGAIDDVGFLQRNEKIKAALTKRTGSQATSASQALDILEKMLVTDQPMLGVMELNWNLLKRNLPSALQPKFHEISQLADNNEETEETSVDLHSMLNEMGIEKFKAYVLAKIRHELAHILMIPEDKIDPDQSIYDMGMDSLMGLELVTGLEMKLGIQIPVMSLSETPRLNALSDKIIQLVQQGNDKASDDALFDSVKNIASVHSQQVDEQKLREFSQSLKQH